MDIVYINDLRVDTIIGVFDWERQIPQRLIFDLELGTDICRAAETDDLSNTVDYKAVSNRVRRFCEDNQPQLVETLAENLSSILLKEFDLPWLRMRINKKGAVTGVRDVGVLIERGQRPGESS